VPSSPLVASSSEVTGNKQSLKTLSVHHFTLFLLENTLNQPSCTKQTPVFSTSTHAFTIFSSMQAFYSIHNIQGWILWSFLRSPSFLSHCFNLKLRNMSRLLPNSRNWYQLMQISRNKWRPWKGRLEMFTAECLQTHSCTFPLFG